MESLLRSPLRRRPAGRPTASSTPAGSGKRGVGNLFLEDLQNAVVEEHWLPIGLRTLIVGELPSLRERLASERHDDSVLVAQLQELVEAAEQYDGGVDCSRTVGLLRALLDRASSR